MGCACFTTRLSSTTSEVVSATHRIHDFLVFDARVVGSLISALIRLEFWSNILFVERFQAIANGKSPMCVIMVESLRPQCRRENFLVLAGAVRSAYQPWKGDSYGVASPSLFRGRG
jgi:hypothetical protein